MDIIDQLSEFLPLDSAFEIERIEKDAFDTEAHIYLKVREESLPPGTGYRAITSARGSIYVFFNTERLSIVVFPFIGTKTLVFCISLR
ncbi:MAG: hypothetical protein U0264_18490 [Candidatus Kapaibacterium sp.]